MLIVIYCGTTLRAELANAKEEQRHEMEASTMNEIIIDASTLPEPLFKLVDTDRVRVRKADGVITMSPVKEDINVIDKLYGSLEGSNLTVEKFQQWLREDERDIDA